MACAMAVCASSASAIVASFSFLSAARSSVREAISSSVVAMKAWFSSMPFFRDWIFSATG